MSRLLFLLTVVVLYQLLLWGFARSLRWVIGAESAARLINISYFLLGNALMGVALSRIFHPMFAIFATVLALLWIWCMIAAVLGLINGFSHGQFAVYLRAALPSLFILVTVWSWFNAHSPVVKHFTLTLNKPVADFRILLASDLHLGNQIGNHAIDKLRAIVDAEKPDLIVMPGDIINDDATPYLKQSMDKNLGKLHAPLGVFATLGNHEGYGNLARNAEAIAQSGIRLLRDEVVETPTLIIVGREDYTNKRRQPLANLVPKQSEKAVIVLDHQPKEIEKASQLPIDIMVSGHTHKGQIFPANFITHLIYRLDYGHEKIGNTDFFVSSGYGFWGVPLRLGSRAEVFVIDVKGKK